MTRLPAYPNAGSRLLALGGCGGIGGSMAEAARTTGLDVRVLGRVGTVEYVVGPILLLLSDAARYVTWQVLHVDGGAHMRDREWQRPPRVWRTRHASRTWRARMP